MILKNYFKRHLSYFSFLSLLFNSILVFDRVINVAPAGFELFILGLGEGSTVKCADCPFREPRFNPSTNMAAQIYQKHGGLHLSLSPFLGSLMTLSSLGHHSEDLAQTKYSCTWYNEIMNLKTYNLQPPIILMSQPPNPGITHLPYTTLLGPDL